MKKILGVKRPLKMGVKRRVIPARQSTPKFWSGHVWASHPWTGQTPTVPPYPVTVYPNSGAPGSVTRKQTDQHSVGVGPVPDMLGWLFWMCTDRLRTLPAVPQPPVTAYGVPECAVTVIPVWPTSVWPRSGVRVGSTFPGPTTSRPTDPGKIGISLRIRSGSMSTSEVDAALPLSPRSRWRTGRSRSPPHCPSRQSVPRSSSSPVFFIPSSYFWFLSSVSNDHFSSIPHRFPGKRILSHEHQIVAVRGTDNNTNFSFIALLLPIHQPVASLSLTRA